MMNTRPWRVAGVTLALALGLGSFLRDAALRPTYVDRDRHAQIERCLAADPLKYDRKSGRDEVQAACTPLLATQNCRAAWAAHYRGEPQAIQPQRACLASICDEWTNTPPFCSHPDYLATDREVFYYAAHMASAVLGRALSPAEDELVMAHLDHHYCEGPLGPPRPEVQWASPHFKRTLALAIQLMRLMWHVDLRLPAWRPPPCKRWGPEQWLEATRRD
ncbi:MAG: hypothetical protein KC613_25990 [Myxococcales bacterium]|nr:hypothetical protein [Myxococcales bacterium]